MLIKWSIYSLFQNTSCFATYENEIFNWTLINIWESIWIFAENIGKTLSNKYGKKLPDSAKKSTTNSIKTASKRAIPKTAEATGDLIGNKIADKITSLSKKSPKELQNDEIEVTKKRYISPEEREQIMN